jgi:hypothetical protein
MKKYFIDEISLPKMTPTKYRRQRSIARNSFDGRAVQVLSLSSGTAYVCVLGKARVLQPYVSKRMRNLAQCFYQGAVRQTPLARAG